jgi:hypothetical protein
MLDTVSFGDWIQNAQKGEEYVYATCCNLEDIPRPDCRTKATSTPEMLERGKEAMAAYERGEVYLIQRRRGPFRFDYIAIKR